MILRIVHLREQGQGIETAAGGAIDTDSVELQRFPVVAARASRHVRAKHGVAADGPTSMAGVVHVENECVFHGR